MGDSTERYNLSDAGHQFYSIFAGYEHTSDFYLSASHVAFCRPDSLRRFARYLRPKDIFAQWSNQPSDDDFLTRQRSVFAGASRVKIPFHNTLEYREFI